MIRLAVVNDEALLRTSSSSSTRPTRSRSSRRLVPAVDIVYAERPDVVLLDIRMGALRGHPNFPGAGNGQRFANDPDP